jgi:spore maturation protein CgeB
LLYDYSFMRLVFIGLTITSSWGNGHATTYRSLLRGLAALGHSVLFLERDKPWYRDSRDLPDDCGWDTQLYGSVEALSGRFAGELAAADVVIVGSYVPDGIAVCTLVQRLAKGVTAFYDIDTPVTLAALEQNRCAYLDASLIPGFDLYLSFSGGPALDILQTRFGARQARALYCSVDADAYTPEPGAVARWDLGYLGTYSDDRQPGLEALLCEPARALPEQRFVVAGPQYPADIAWPANCERIEHAPPATHRSFYNAQRLTLNITRADMVRLGYSPSVRLFEAAACGTPIISDDWSGLDTLFIPGDEIIIARSTADVVAVLQQMPAAELAALGQAARRRVLASHTGMHRAEELVGYLRKKAVLF